MQLINRKKTFETFIEASFVLTKKLEHEDAELRGACEREFANIVYRYTISFKPRCEKYGFEIYNVTRNCFKYYNKEKGESFLKYYKISLNNEIRRAEAKEKIDIRTSSMHIAKNERNDAAKLANYLSEHPDETISSAIRNPEKVLKGMAASRNHMNKIAALYENASSFSMDTAPCDEDGFSDMYNIIADKKDDISALLDGMAFSQVIDIITAVYLSSEKKAKPAIASKLTRCFVDHTDPEKLSEISKMPFFDENIAMYCHNNYDRKVTDMELATMCGKSHTCYSGIWKRFCERLKAALDEADTCWRIYC